ncbi:MAG TPA: LysR family transcriptional regulator [Candidatus Binatia bacterium]|jgi:molybdate transport system regulatory protein|nr:LysR family transcriptional regulator [Candidatus Binatia bacterium]
MRKDKKVRGGVVLRPRLRVMCHGETALGPGRVDLLEHVAETGSLRAAAARMDMSYMRAWTLVKTTNRWFSRPVVEVVRGGKTGGGAKLTAAGWEVVGLYRRMEKQSEKAMKGTWGKLRKLLHG